MMKTQPRSRSGPTSRVPLAYAAFALCLALTSTACGTSMKNPDIKQNPHPKQRYDITLKIDGAPGPFDAITGSVDYRVSNGRCVPLTPISGATLEPEKNVPLVFTRVSDNVYKGTLYIDLFLDEDYYGLGVCHWDVVAAGIDLTIGKLDFSPSIFLDDIKSGKPVIRYFSRRAYLEYRNTSLVDIGNAHRDDFKEDAPHTFSTTLTAEEQHP